MAQKWVRTLYCSNGEPTPIRGSAHCAFEQAARLGFLELKEKHKPERKETRNSFPPTQFCTGHTCFALCQSQGSRLRGRPPVPRAASVAKCVPAVGGRADVSLRAEAGHPRPHTVNTPGCQNFPHTQTDSCGASRPSSSTPPPRGPAAAGGSSVPGPGFPAKDGR